MEKEVEHIKERTVNVENFDKLVLNLTRNWSLDTNTPRQILENAVPYWMLPKVLGRMFARARDSMI